MFEIRGGGHISCRLREPCGLGGDRWQSKTYTTPPWWQMVTPPPTQGLLQLSPAGVSAPLRSKCVLDMCRIACPTSWSGVEPYGWVPHWEARVCWTCAELLVQPVEVEWSTTGVSAPLRMKSVLDMCRIAVQPVEVEWSPMGVSAQLRSKSVLDMCRIACSTSWSGVEPYGCEYPIENQECIGHVQNCLFNQLNWSGALQVYVPIEKQECTGHVQNCLSNQLKWSGALRVLMPHWETRVCWACAELLVQPFEVEWSTTGVSTPLRSKSVLDMCRIACSTSWRVQRGGRKKGRAGGRIGWKEKVRWRRCWWSGVGGALEGWLSAPCGWCSGNAEASGGHLLSLHLL